MKRVIIETPYAGNIEQNLKYVRACLRDCLLRGEAPFASHALYTQPGVLDDEVQSERDHGIEAGFAWREVAALTAFYVDRGWSRGMLAGLKDCETKRLPYEIRLIENWQDDETTICCHDESTNW